MTMSGAWRWPVSSPWQQGPWGDGTPTAYLSAWQRVVLLYLSRSTKKGRRTLDQMTKVLGISSRGQLSRELRRLRQLELIGYETRRGPHGWHRLWLNRAAARMRGARHPRAGGTRTNDSPSTTFGGFLSLLGLERAERERRRPPARAGPAARVGPRKGHRPPRHLNATCPAGHRTTVTRRSSESAPDGQLLRAVFSGICRRCGGRPVSEIFEMAFVPEPRRPLSPAELADPELLERRRRQAASFLAEGLRVEERTIRRYLDEPLPVASERRGPLADVLETVAPRETIVSDEPPGPQLPSSGDDRRPADRARGRPVQPDPPRDPPRDP